MNFDPSLNPTAKLSNPMHVSLKFYDNDFICGWVETNNDNIPPKTNNEELVITSAIKKLINHIRPVVFLGEIKLQVEMLQKWYRM